MQSHSHIDSQLNTMAVGFYVQYNKGNVPRLGGKILEQILILNVDQQRSSFRKHQPSAVGATF